MSSVWDYANKTRDPLWRKETKRLWEEYVMKTNPDYVKKVYETCPNCVYNSTGDVNGTRQVGHPKCDFCRRYSNFAYKKIKDIGVKIDNSIPSIRPAHYQNNWDVARFADSRDYDLYQFNVLKYVDRHEKKDGKKDLLKALDYLQEYINVRYPEEN